MLYGTYHCAVSKTNGITIPKALFNLVGDSLVLIHIPGRLFMHLYQKTRFDAVVENCMIGQREAGLCLSRTATLVSVDTQGRFTLPKEFFTKLETEASDVVLEANADHLRLWPESVYKCNLHNEEERLKATWKRLEPLL